MSERANAVRWAIALLISIFVGCGESKEELRENQTSKQELQQVKDEAFRQGVEAEKNAQLLRERDQLAIEVRDLMIKRLAEKAGEYRKEGKIKEAVETELLVQELMKFQAQNEN